MKRFFKSVLIGILLVTVISLSKSMWSSYQKLGTLNTTQQQIKSLQAENNQLEVEKKFRTSDFFVEKTGRDKLGLGRAGETKFVAAKPSTPSAELEEAKLANWQVWLKLFF